MDETKEKGFRFETLVHSQLWCPLGFACWSPVSGHVMHANDSPGSVASIDRSFEMSLLQPIYVGSLWSIILHVMRWAGIGFVFSPLDANMFLSRLFLPTKRHFIFMLGTKEKEGNWRKGYKRRIVCSQLCLPVWWFNLIFVFHAFSFDFIISPILLLKVLSCLSISCALYLRSYVICKLDFDVKLILLLIALRLCLCVWDPIQMSWPG